MQDIVIVGAGGQGLIVADILLRSYESTVRAIGFVDDAVPLNQCIATLPLLGPIAALPGVLHDAIVVAIGDNALRRSITNRLIAAGERLITARHAFSSISPDVKIGEGSMISAGVVITPGVKIGRGVLLNTMSSVDHHSIVGDFAHVSAGATVGANCTLGDEVLIALGAKVASNRIIGARSVIGAGAAVVRDIPSDVVAFGVPARVHPRD
jgi:acetyltransferase EpsM